MKKYFFFFTLAFPLIVLNAQNDIPTPDLTQTKHYMGFYVGNIATILLSSYTNNFFQSKIDASPGVGFSYCYMPKKLGVQLTALPFGKKDNLWLNAGISLFYSLHSFANKKINIYSFIAGSGIYTHTNYNRWYYSVYDVNESACCSYEEEDIRWNAGPGLALDINLGKTAKVNFMLGYSIFDFTDNYRFTVDGGFGFYFKL